MADEVIQLRTPAGKPVSVEPPAPPPAPTQLSLLRRLLLQLYLRWRGFFDKIDENIKLAILHWLTIVQTVRHMRGLIEGQRHDMDRMAIEVARYRKVFQRRPDLARVYNDICEEEQRAKADKAKPARASAEPAGGADPAGGPVPAGV